MVAFAALMVLVVLGAVGLFILLDPRTQAWIAEQLAVAWAVVYSLLLPLWEAVSSPFR